jgi:hypothetical protein
MEGILLKDGYSFIMEYGSLEKFLYFYHIYEASKFDLEAVSFFSESGCNFESHPFMSIILDRMLELGIVF